MAIFTFTAWTIPATWRDEKVTAVFEGVGVPEILLSGDHGRIEEWRAEQREQRTRERRPDLIPNGTDPEN